MTGYPGSPTATRLFLSEVRNSFNQLVGGNWQQSVLVQNDYSYDNAGQRLTNAISDNTGPIRTEQYTYDEINRLKTVNYGDGQTQSYTFDAMGNRTQKVDSVNGTENYGYNAANMLLSRGANSYTNDLNGNTLTGGGRTNTWDSENRLVQCVAGGTTSVFTYGSDGLRRRAAVTVGGNTTTTDFILDGSMQVRERRNSANYATYLVGPRGPEYRRDDVAGTVRWYLYDGLGSVLGEIDPNGNVTATRKYDVYGSVRASTGVSTSRQKFVGSLGHPSDDETGLIYMRARYCDPVTGRFVSEDRAKHGNNWFMYANDNPVRYADPDGKLSQDQINWLCGVYANIGCGLLCTGAVTLAAALYMYFSPKFGPAGSFATLAEAVTAGAAAIQVVAGAYFLLASWLLIGMTPEEYDIEGDIVTGLVKGGVDLIKSLSPWQDLPI